MPELEKLLSEHNISPKEFLDLVVRSSQIIVALNKKCEFLEELMLNTPCVLEQMEDQDVEINDEEMARIITMTSSGKEPTWH